MSTTTLPTSDPAADPAFSQKDREILLRVLSAAAFLIFFQAYLLAPLIPSLVTEFHSTEQTVGLLVPAYMLPYGLSTLFYGPLSDRVGRKKILLTLLAMMVLTTAGLATSHSISQLLAWRVVGGITTGGIIPIALALFGDIFPYSDRGRAMGWIFGAIAGGLAFGSTLGALLNPYLGWRWVLLLTALLKLFLLLAAWNHRRLLDVKTPSTHSLSPRAIAAGYASLFSKARGRWTYGYILLNGMFHSGIFSWLGAYFHDRYNLSDTGIGLALLGYGVPGMLLSPMIGHAADRLGRSRIIPAGLALGALAALLLAPHIPLAAAVCLVTLLSFGFDMSHPLLAGIVSTLDPHRRGQAMGMNAFVLFIGFGLGSLAFQESMRLPMAPSLPTMAAALATFALIEALAALVAIHAFRNEHPSAPSPIPV